MIRINFTHFEAYKAIRCALHVLLVCEPMEVVTSSDLAQSTLHTIIDDII